MNAGALRLLPSAAWQRWALAALAALLTWVALSALVAALLPEPSGPPASVYATTVDGAAAYGTLLARFGHRVEPLRTAPHAASLDPAGTVFVLDPTRLAAADVAALRSFVTAGGTLVAGGAQPQAWLDQLLVDPPRWAPGATGPATVAGPGVRACGPSAVCGVGVVMSAGEGRFLDAGAGRAVLAGPGGVELVVAAVGNGRVELLADVSPLANRLLATADDAQLGLDLAGPPSRPAVFLETVHGFGAASGWSAIPSRWRWALIVALAAAVLFAAAHARRLGSPDPPPAPVAPERAQYVYALAATVARTRTPEDGAEPVRREARAILELLARSPASEDAASVREAGRRCGLAEDELDAILGAGEGEDGVLASGRALARLERLLR